jgi:DNA-binding NtrC family response regulator
VTRVGEASQAATLIATGEFQVGIVCLHDLPESHWFQQHFTELFSRARGIEWIAIIASGLLENSSVRVFIASHFLDFHTLPVSADRLSFSLGHVSGMAELLSVTDRQCGGGNIIGSSAEIQKLMRDIEKISAVNVPVLIAGETGTGKELTATEIHRRSSRQQGPFVAVNCAELPPTLIHAELFGYEKGAFTGASARKIGYLEQACGGTIFLDEIGDLPLDLQVLLLRFLQEKTIRRVGGVADIQVDARVISATHVDLAASVHAGDFREDLVHRLNVLQISIPPLRERPGDIEALAYYFFNKYSTESARSVQGFSPAALQALRQHSWPGNVRELANRVRRGMVMCDGCHISPEDLGILSKHSVATSELETLEEARQCAERQAILVALQQTGGNAWKTAKALGVSRATFYRLMGEHNLTSSSWLNDDDDEDVGFSIA